MKVVHLYIEGGGDDEFAQAVIDELHPGFLKYYDGEIISHTVSPWPESPFSHAYVDLRMNFDIELKQTNCKVGERLTWNLRIYLVSYDSFPTR